MHSKHGHLIAAKEERTGIPVQGGETLRRRNYPKDVQKTTKDEALVLL